MDPPPQRSSSLRLLLEIGRGGMGIVYLGLAQGPAGWTKLKVIKRLRPDLASDPKAVTMFLDEARVSARLLHPNVVQTNDVGFDGKHYFLEMEYLEGQSYESLARRAPDLPLALSLWILTQALAGLQYAHTLKDLDGKPLHVVHRDVSPHNVFVTYEGNVKLLDFGIAKAADSSSETQTGTVKGKATYMAPEQASRGAVDHRTDIFAVGVMLWQAITGARLWGERSDFEIFLELQKGAIPSPRTVKPDVAASLETICRRALAIDPNERFASAAEMQAAIEAHLETLGEPHPQRQLAKLMTERFAKDRADARAEIEAQLRGGGEGAPPRLRDEGQTERGTGSASLSAAKTIGKEGSGAKAIARRRRTAWLAAATVAMGGVAIAGVVYRVGHRAAPAPSASATAPARECATNLDCVRAHEAKPYVCRKEQGRCAALASEACKVLADPGDVENDRTLWLGAMFPMTGEKAKIAGLAYVNAVDLARRDFAQIAHGVPTPNGETRPLAIVACDDARDATAAARHLVDDVGVPAVIGFGSTQEVMDLSQSLFMPKRVLVLVAANTSALITTIPQPRGEPRLVWRTVLSSAQTGKPVSLIVSELLEPRLRSKPTRVALVRHNDTAGLSFAEVLFATVRFNGKSALENKSDFRQFVLEGEGAQNVIAELAAFRPHVVLSVGFSELTASLFAPLEAAWPRGETFRPIYILPTELRGEELFRFVGRDADLKRRFIGIVPPPSTPANAAFTMRYNEVFKDSVSRDLSPTAPYDALYLAAFASYAMGDAPLTGPSIARGIARLVPPGKPVDVGPTHIFQVFEELRNGGQVDLNGAGNRLDFDLTTGESPGDYVVQCIGDGDAIESGIQYETASGKLVHQGGPVGSCVSIMTK